MAKKKVTKKKEPVTYSISLSEAEARLDEISANCNEQIRLIKKELNEKVDTEFKRMDAESEVYRKSQMELAKAHNALIESYLAGFNKLLEAKL